MRVWMLLTIALSSMRASCLRTRSLRLLDGYRPQTRKILFSSAIDSVYSENIVGKKDSEVDLIGIKVTQKKYKVDEDAVRRHIKCISDNIRRCRLSSRYMVLFRE